MEQLEQYYSDHQAEINEAFYNFCFNEGRFETLSDANKHYNNDDAFWEFVGDYANME